MEKDMYGSDVTVESVTEDRNRRDRNHIGDDWCYSAETIDADGERRGCRFDDPGVETLGSCELGDFWSGAHIRRLLLMGDPHLEMKGGGLIRGGVHNFDSCIQLYVDDASNDDGGEVQEKAIYLAKHMPTILQTSVPDATENFLAPRIYSAASSGAVESLTQTPLSRQRAGKTRGSMDPHGGAPDRATPFRHDGEIRVWDVSGVQLNESCSGTEAGAQWAHIRRVNGVAISHSRQMFASVSDDSTVALWSARTESLALSPMHVEAGNACCLSPDDVMVATPSKDNTVQLAIGLANNTIELRNTTTRQKIQEFKSGLPHRNLWALKISSRPGKIYCLLHGIDTGPGFIVWDEHTGRVLLHRYFNINRAVLAFDTPSIGFSADDACVLIRYHHHGDGDIEVNKIIMGLPRDFRTRDVVKCWTSAGDVIMIGMYSGQVASPRNCAESRVIFLKMSSKIVDEMEHKTNFTGDSNTGFEFHAAVFGRTVGVVVDLGKVGV
ncbi:hypothetical protein C8R44DRAFT_734868 [Mycena epipterygia]|nr:hypothetical protein C8R44DRAFT_734868 [Mycena epipterygia]